MPTAKRRKYLDRLAAKQSNLRTQEERQIEYDKFMGKFAEFGISGDIEEIEKFDTMAKDWVETGNVYQGIIPIIGLDYNLVYILSNNKKNDVGVMLKATRRQANNSDVQKQHAQEKQRGNRKTRLMPQSA